MCEVGIAVPAMTCLIANRAGMRWKGAGCQSEVQGFWLKKQCPVERNINEKPELLTHYWRTCSFSEIERENYNRK